MEHNLDIRWEQRFSTYVKAFAKLSKAIEILRPMVDSRVDIDEVDELQIEGLIQRFEYTHELAWKVMADYAKYQGYQDIKGSRDAIRYALQNGLVFDGRWMDTIVDRNRTSHTYDEHTAYEILVDIVNVYYGLFRDFSTRMDNLRSYNTTETLF